MIPHRRLQMALKIGNSPIEGIDAADTHALARLILIPTSCWRYRCLPALPLLSLLHLQIPMHTVVRPSTQKTAPLRVHLLVFLEAFILNRATAGRLPQLLYCGGLFIYHIQLCKYQNNYEQ